MGERWGLPAYAYNFPPKEMGGPSRSIALLGTAPSGELVEIRCLDSDMSKVAFCSLYSRLKHNVVVIIAIPASDMDRWSSYLEFAASYLDSRLES